MPWSQEAVFVDPRFVLFDPNSLRPDRDRIVVFGGSPHTLGLLRLATIRSDEVVLVAAAIDAPTRRFVDRFAVDYREILETEANLDGAAAAVIALGDVGRENVLVRAARRRGIPIHVESRSLVSDFTMLQLVERDLASFAPRSQREVSSQAAA